MAANGRTILLDLAENCFKAILDRDLNSNLDFDPNEEYQNTALSAMSYATGACDLDLDDWEQLVKAIENEPLEELGQLLAEMVVKYTERWTDYGRPSTSEDWGRARNAADTDGIVYVWAVSTHRRFECGGVQEYILEKAITEEAIAELVENRAERIIEDIDELFISHQLHKEDEHRVCITDGNISSSPIYVSAIVTNVRLSDFTPDQASMLTKGEWVTD